MAVLNAERLVQEDEREAAALALRSNTNVNANVNAHATGSTGGGSASGRPRVVPPVSGGGRGGGRGIAEVGGTSGIPPMSRPGGTVAGRCGMGGGVMGVQMTFVLMWSKVEWREIEEGCCLLFQLSEGGC